MIYGEAILALAFCHAVHIAARTGRHVPSLLEKASVLVAAIAGMAAIAELCTTLLSRFDGIGGDLFGWVVDLVAFGLGLFLFLIFVFVLLPKPIQHNKSAEQAGDGDA
jgi:hypothetical protein